MPKGDNCSHPRWRVEEERRVCEVCELVDPLTQEQLDERDAMVRNDAFGAAPQAY